VETLDIFINFRSYAVSKTTHCVYHDMYCIKSSIELKYHIFHTTSMHENTHLVCVCSLFWHVWSQLLSVAVMGCDDKFLKVLMTMLTYL